MIKVTSYTISLAGNSKFHCFVNFTPALEIYSLKICNTYGTAQFKLDTRVQQTRVRLTDFVEAHVSCSHAGCMAREHMHDRIHCPRASIHSIRHA